MPMPFKLPAASFPSSYYSYLSIDSSTLSSQHHSLAYLPCESCTLLHIVHTDCSSTGLFSSSAEAMLVLFQYLSYLCMRPLESYSTSARPESQLRFYQFCLRLILANMKPFTFQALLTTPFPLCLFASVSRASRLLLTPSPLLVLSLLSYITPTT